MPANFFLIEHEVGKDFLKFYSLYYNIQCDKVRLSNYFDYKDDREYKENIYKQIKPFYKTYSLKIKPNEECKVNYLKDTDIVLGATIESKKEMTASEFNEKLQTPDTFILDNCKTNVSNDSALSEKPFDTTESCSNICVKYINISSLSLKEIPLYRKDENQIYGEAGYYKPEKVGVYKNTFSAAECNNRVPIDCDNSVIDIDSEFSNPTYMIPMDYVELNKDKIISEKDVQIYQKRYPISGREVYRVIANAKGKFDEVNRPLYYVDITNNISRNIKDIIFIITEKEIALLLQKDKVKFTFEYDKYGLIKDFQEEQIADDSDSENNVETEYSNDKYCICYYSNISSDQQKSIKLFWDGNEITPLNIEKEGFYKLLASDKKLTAELAKSFTNDSLTVFEVRPTVVNHLDSFLEFNTAQYGEKLKKIKDKSKYYLCNRCIQPELQLKYDLDLASAKITSIKGTVKTDIEAANIKTEINQLCFRSSPEANSTPLYVIKKGQEFYYEPIPERTKIESLADENEEKYIYHFNNFSFNKSVCSCDIPEDCVSVKLVNNPEIHMDNIDKDQIVTLQDGISVTPATILGQAFYDFKYDEYQSYYDVCMFMNGKLPNNKDYKKKYWFYKKIKGGETVYEDTKKLHSFYLPLNTEVELSELEVYNNTSQFVAIKIKRIPVFVEEKKYLEADYRGYKELIQKPDYFLLNQHKINANKNTSEVDKTMAELFYNNITKIMKKNLVVFEDRKNEVGVYIDPKDIGLREEFYCYSPYLPDVTSRGACIIHKADCTKLCCYQNDPLKSSLNTHKYLYLPVNTHLTCKEIISYSNVTIYKIQILSLPVYISKEYFKKAYKLKENNPVVWLSKKKLEEFSKKNDYEKFYKAFDDFKASAGLYYDEYISSKDNGNDYAGIYVESGTLGLTKKFYIDRQTALKNFSAKNPKSKDIINAKLNITPTVSKCNASTDLKLYDNNPDYLNCKEKQLAATDIITRIDTQNKLQKTSRGVLYKISLKDNPKEYYINVSDLEKYADDATDWEKYFTDIGEDEDIKSISLSKIKDKLELSKEEVERFNNYESLEDVYNDTGFDCNKEMVEKFRKIVVKHPHEWDSDGYKDLKDKDPKIKYAKDYSKAVEIVSKLTCFKNGSEKNKTYFHPIYFFNHIKSAGMMEFNPYVGKDIITTTEPKTTCHVYDNPGFAPYMPSEYPDNIYNFQGYAPITGHFRGNYNGKAHAGVDFDGPNVPKPLRNSNKEAAIKSLIYAKYIGEGNYGNDSWGRFLVFQSVNNSNHFFILAHLSETNGCVINFQENAIVSPGTIVGYVGNTGNCTNCNTQVQRDAGNGAHLHVQLVVKDKAEQVYNPSTRKLLSLNDDSINPFDYNDKYSKTNFRG